MSIVNARIVKHFNSFVIFRITQAYKGTSIDNRKGPTELTDNKQGFQGEKKIIPSLVPDIPQIRDLPF